MLAIVLMLGDRYFNLLDSVKPKLQSMTEPLYHVADLPHMVSSWVFERSQSEDDLLVRQTKLETENLMLRGKLQRLQTLARENSQLRDLLNANSLVQEKVLVAEVIATSPDPKYHFAIINKGARDDIYNGQAVIDAHGLYGQVMSVSEKTSRVLLVSDRRHAIPVSVDRNGLRLLVEGDNDFNELRLPHVALTTDLKQGDVLSTSGLGGVFPIGYPVAQVTSIKHQEGRAFAEVTAKPFALLDSTRNVLLLFNELHSGHQNTDAALGSD